MIGLPSLQAIDRAQGARIWMASEATDMRCGFDRLAEQVKTVIGENPQSGHLFVFRSRRGDRLKTLVWDRDGFVLWYKRLEAGVSKLPRVEQGARSVELRASELAMILDGIDVSKLKRLPRYQRAIENRGSKVAEKKRKKERRKEKKKRTAQSIAICVTKLVEARLNERADQRNFLEQLTRRQAGVAGNDLDAWLPDRWKQAHADRCAALEIPPLDS